MWSILIGLLPGIFKSVNDITASIANERIASINAKTDQERVVADANVEALQAQRDVLIADASKSKIDMWMRTLIALGPTVILNKIFIWDKVFGWGSTEMANTDYAWNVIMVVVGFYFIHSMASIFRS